MPAVAAMGLESTTVMRAEAMDWLSVGHVVVKYGNMVHSVVCQCVLPLPCVWSVHTEMHTAG